MRPLPKGGGDAHPNEVGAPRRQTESPLKTSHSEIGYSAHRLEDQDLGPAYVPQVGDTTLPITNAGHARKCIKAICRLAEAEGLADEPAAFFAVAWLDDTAARADPLYRRMLGWFAATYLTNVSQEERDVVLADLRARPRPITHRSLGELLGLTNAQRERYEFWLADACDVDPAEARRAKDRERKALKRRAKGIPPKGAWIAEATALDPSTPISTHYDRRKHGRKPRKGQRAARANSETSSGRGGAKRAKKSETSSGRLIEPTPQPGFS